MPRTQSRDNRTCLKWICRIPIVQGEDANNVGRAGQVSQRDGAVVYTLLATV